LFDEHYPYSLIALLTAAQRKGAEIVGAEYRHQAVAR